MNSNSETTKQMALLIFLEPFLIRTAISLSLFDSVQVTSVFNSKAQNTEKKVDFHDGKKITTSLIWHDFQRKLRHTGIVIFFFLTFKYLIFLFKTSLLL